MSVVVPPMVTCPLGRPPGYRAAWILNRLDQLVCLDQLVFHCCPPPGSTSTLGSSMGPGGKACERSREGRMREEEDDRLL
jgi:hypothetical protein